MQFLDREERNFKPSERILSLKHSTVMYVTVKAFLNAS